MWKKQLPAVLAVMVLQGALSYLSQTAAILWPYPLNQWPFRIEQVLEALLVSWLLVQVGALRGAAFPDRRSRYLRGYLPAAAGMGVLMALLSRRGPSLAAISLGGVLAFSFAGKLQLVAGLWLLLSLLGRFCWRVPTAGQPLRMAGWLCLTALVSAVPATFLLLRTAECIRLGEAAPLPRLSLLYALQQVLGIAAMSCTALVWAVGGAPRRKKSDA